MLTHFQSFDDDYADFETKIQDLDRRLATIFCQAFDDCNSIESCAKVRGDSGGTPRGNSAGQHPVDAENGGSKHPEGLLTVFLPRLKVREESEPEVTVVDSHRARGAKLSIYPYPIQFPLYVQGAKVRDRQSCYKNKTHVHFDLLSRIHTFSGSHRGAASAAVLGGGVTADTRCSLLRWPSRVP